MVGCETYGLAGWNIGECAGGTIADIVVGDGHCAVGDGHCVVSCRSDIGRIARWVVDAAIYAIGAGLLVAQGGHDACAFSDRNLCWNQFGRRPWQDRRARYFSRIGDSLEQVLRAGNIRTKVDAQARRIRG